MSDILRQEQEGLRYRRLGLNAPTPDELQAASAEERYGAGLLRALLPHLHFVHGDDQAVILRAVVPNWLMDEMCWWGDTDGECNADREAEVG